ncbi:MAG: FHA domain-containing protein [Deltaproteobacteria bacterium]|nr:FHA domain-containing protein [Deltaproteobacteria bacterium]
MSITLRKIIFCFVGLLAGLAAWPVAEIILLFQVSFPSYLMFSIFLGAIFGLVIGLFMGAKEGQAPSNRKSLFNRIIAGSLVGVLGGAVGFLIGQALLFVLGEYFIHSGRAHSALGLPLSRAVGWAFLGLFVGVTDGVRSGSLRKIKVGALGGLLGGILGGLALQYIGIFIENMMYARFAGLLLLGLSIGFFYGLVEDRLSFGVLRLLNGKFKGKEFLINQRKTRIGSAGKMDIQLNQYGTVADFQAEIVSKKDCLLIKSRDEKGTVIVNDSLINEHELKFEDVIQIGKAKMIYLARSL